MAEFILTLIKVVLTFLLLPIAYASGQAFYTHLETYPQEFQLYFITGSFVCLGVFLFLYQFWGVFEFGRRAVANVFKFVAPFDHWIASSLPIYTIICMLTFYVISVLGDVKVLDHNFLFMAGFTLTMHILVVAQDLQNDEKTPIKPTYMFAITTIFILNLFLMVFLFDLVMGKLTIVEYAKGISNTALDIYTDMFNGFGLFN